MDNKIKHLEFIQSAIERMANNSFLIKGWAITLVAALFALASKDAVPLFVLVAYFPVATFWLLDAYFLSQERCFRSLYNHVRSLDENQIDFSMDTSNCRNENDSIICQMFTRTLMAFYVPLILIMLLILYFL